MVKLLEAKKVAIRWLEETLSEMEKMSDTLFDWAEPGLREYRSSKLLAEFMKENDFDRHERHIRSSAWLNVL